MTENIAILVFKNVSMVFSYIIKLYLDEQFSLSFSKCQYKCDVFVGQYLWLAVHTMTKPNKEICLSI